MELAKTLVHEIAIISRRVVSAATDYARRKGSRNVQSCHFRLEEEMQAISVAADGILGVLDKSSPPNGPKLDDRLRDWFSSDELSMCLCTLHQMESMLRAGDTWTNMVFNALRALPPEDKIDAVMKLFDSRKNYFHFLLTTDVWNREDPQQQQPVRSIPAQDKRFLHQKLKPRTDVSEAHEENASTGSSLVENKATSVQDTCTKQVDTRRKLDDILCWLNGLGCAAKQEETLSLWQPDTCTWLLATTEYESWRNNDNSFLWLQGKAGSGKTVLASFLVDSLKHKRLKGEALAYFYCDFRNDRSTGASEVMRSLLSQLLHHGRDENIVPGDLVDNLVREKNGDIPILNNVERLATLVPLVAKQFNPQPLVVVDALDECKDVEKLVGGLLTLAKAGMRLFVTSRPLQVIKDDLCGRPFISVDKMASAVSADIALHVTRELDSRRRLRDLEPSFKAEIHNVLCEKADGMFRWVQCQIDTLVRCATVTEARKALKNLPIGLDETYERILATMDSRSPDGKLALRALVWLVGALRPLRLAEILEGLTVDLGRQTMDPEAGAMHKGVLLHACGSLVTYNEKTSVLILSHFSVKEYLTGELTRKRLLRYHISYQHAHERLARICICYVTLYLKYIHGSSENSSQLRIMQTINGHTRNMNGTGSYPSDTPLARLFKSQELLGYVFTSGLNHLAHLGQANHAVLKDMMTLQLDIERYPAAWEQILRMSQRYKLPVPWPTCEHDFMLYVLTAFASDSLLHAFLGPTRRVLKPKYRTNPLVYAAHFGKLQHAQLLVSRGAQVNEKGLVVGGPYRRLPLEVAVSRQQEAVVDLLLSIGSVVPSHLFTRTTDHNFPIRIARRLLQTDEFVEWAAEPGNNPPSPLGLLERQLPLRHESDIIVAIRRLFQVGLDITVRDPAQRTALHLAIRGRYLAIVVYFLLIGTPPMSRSTPLEGAPTVHSIVGTGIDVHDTGTGDTYMHSVVRFLDEEECLEAAKALVGAGYKPFAYNQARKTPLHLALEKQYLSVAYYLCSLGTPLDTLLAIVETSAVARWKSQAFNALVRGGDGTCSIARSEDALSHRQTMLLEKYQRLEMAKLHNAESGLGPSCRNTGGKRDQDLELDFGSYLASYLLSTGKPLPPNALFRIMRSTLPEKCRVQAIRCLLDKGTDVHELEMGGNTLLHAALLVLDECQGLEITQLLVGAGCDPFFCNADGKTPLHIALYRRFSVIADCLLSTGRQPPPDTPFAILQSELPDDWRAQTTRSLVENGSDVYQLSEGDTLLHAAVHNLDERHGLDIARLLINTGCDPFRCNADGKTPLHIVLDRQLCSVADTLISTGKPLPPDGLFSILRSTLPGDWRAQRICSLVGKSNDICQLWEEGNTLLHAAVLALNDCQALHVAQHLVGAGCDPTVRNEEGKTALQIAVQTGAVSVVEYIHSLDGSFPDDILFSAFESRSEDIMPMLRMLISKGANTRAVSVNGNNLLHAAISSLASSSIDLQHLGFIKALVNSGCDAFAPNSRGETPLHLAVASGCLRIITYFSSITTSPSLPTDILAYALGGGTAPTNWAHDNRLQLLAKKGANIHFRAADGRTLLHMAIKNAPYSFGVGRRRYPGLEVVQWQDSFLLGTVRFLVNSGCDPLLRDVNGKSAVDFAASRGFHDVVEYLSSRGSRRFSPRGYTLPLTDTARG